MTQNSGVNCFTELPKSSLKNSLFLFFLITWHYNYRNLNSDTEKQAKRTCEENAFQLRIAQGTKELQKLLVDWLNSLVTAVSMLAAVNFNILPEIWSGHLALKHLSIVEDITSSIPNRFLGLS